MRRVISRLLIAVGVLVAIVACTSEDGTTAEQLNPTSSCEQSAQTIIDRFDSFLMPYAEMDPDEFLAADLEGLEDFQNDVAELVVQVATDPNDDCTERDLETQVATALDNYAGEGTLNQYLVSLVRQGVQVETRDVRVEPGDDLVAILATLGPGSSVTFAAGTFTLDASIIVQGDLVMVGAGRDETVLASSADTAAIAVLGGGSVVMNDFTVRHTGELPASVLIAVDSDVELVNMAIAGGVVDDEGGGGSGVVLTETEQATSEPAVTIDASVIADNAAAGIAVTGSYAPVVLNSTIEANAQCGICFFDNGTGQVQSTTLRANGVGIQASNQADPEIATNMFVDNQVAGLLIEGSSAATVIENTFEGPETVAIDVQDDARAVLQRNTIGEHAVGISLRGTSQASASGNTIANADVAILIGESAAPMVFDNMIENATVAGMLHADTSTGDFTANRVIPAADGAGIVVEGDAVPRHIEARVEGGLVGVVFRENAQGLLNGSVLDGQQVGIETSDQASPTIESNEFIGALEAAAILGGQGAADFRSNTVSDPVAIGIQTSGSASPTVAMNQVVGGDTAILVTEASKPTITGNTLTDQNFGVGVSGTAAPIIEDNEINNARAGAMSFEGETSGQIRNNTVTDAGVVGFRIAGSAAPVIESNMLFALVQEVDAEQDTTSENSGDTDADDAVSGAGLLYAEQGSGEARGNQLFGFVIGIQVSDQAAPALVANRVDGAGIGGVGILYGAEGAGIAEENLSINQQLGFQLSGTTSPTLTNNAVENAAVASFLVQGESAAELTGNACIGGGGVGIVVLEEAAPVLDSNECTVQ